MKRPSLVVQYVCFVSLGLLPWLLALGANDHVILTMAAWWLVLGVAAALWNRNVEEE